MLIFFKRKISLIILFLVNLKLPVNELKFKLPASTASPRRHREYCFYYLFYFRFKLKSRNEQPPNHQWKYRTTQWRPICKMGFFFATLFIVQIMYNTVCCGILDAENLGPDFLCCSLVYIYILNFYSNWNATILFKNITTKNKVK